MIMELIGHKDYVRVLLALREQGTLRFNQIQKSLDLNPVQVDRALKFLRKGLWVVTRTIPTAREHIAVEYRLGKRGAAFLDSFDSFRGAVRQRSAELGSAEVEELQSLGLLEHSVKTPATHHARR